jgi:DNA polymerase III alpha subunit
MRDRTECTSSRPRQHILLLIIATSLIGAPAPAQKTRPSTASLPKYDVHAEIKIKGTIEEVKLPPKGSEKEIVHLQVNDGTNSIDVYLCPKTFLDDMGMSFTKADAIAMTGSKAKQGDANIFLVREIVKGNDTFVLRDGKGDPVWDWHR